MIDSGCVACVCKFTPLTNSAFNDELNYLENARKVLTKCSSSTAYIRLCKTI